MLVLLYPEGLSLFFQLHAEIHVHIATHRVVSPRVVWLHVVPYPLAILGRIHVLPYEIRIKLFYKVEPPLLIH